MHRPITKHDLAIKIEQLTRRIRHAVAPPGQDGTPPPHSSRPPNDIAPAEPPGTFADTAFQDTASAFHTLVEGMREGAAILAPDDTVLTCNRRLAEMLKTDCERVMGHSLLEFIPTEDRPLIRTLLDAAPEEFVKVQLRLSGNNAFAIPVELKVKRLAVRGMRVYAILATDLTRRRRTEEQLAFQAHLLANVNDAVIATDEQYQITYWNAAAERMYGWTADEVLGRVIRDVLRPIVTEQADAARQLLVESGELHRESVQQRRDGTAIDVEYRWVALPRDDGTTSGYVGVARNISKRKRAEESLQAAMREIRQLNVGLEQRVAERTAELEQANRALQKENAERQLEILARQQTEARLRDVLQSLEDAMLTARESERRLKQMVKVGRFGVLTFDAATGTLLDANDAFLEMTGYDRSHVDAHALTWQAMTPPEFMDISLQQMEQLHTTGQVGPYEKQYLRRDGSRSWMLFAGADVGDGTVVEHCVDISDRKQLEQGLEQTNRRVGEILASIQDGFFSIDREWRLTYVNQRAASVIGATPAELMGQNLWKKFPQLLGTRLEQAYRRAMIQRVPRQLEIRGLQSTAIYDVRIYPSAEGISVYWVDVTERRRAEQERVWLASFPQRNPIPIVEVDTLGTIHYLNPAAERALPDLKQRGLAHPWLAEWASITRAFHSDARQTPQRVVQVGTVWYLQTLSFIRETQRVRIYGVEITDRKRAEQEREQLLAQLETERARWRGIVEGIADEVWVCDTEGRMSLMNVPEVTAMGLPEFENKTMAEVYEQVDILNMDGKLRPVDQAPLYRALKGEVVRGEEIMRHRETGRTRYRQFSAAPMRDAAGAITGSVAIVRDVTEYKNAEERIEQLNHDLERQTTNLAVANQELESFTYSVSHDLRTPLAAILNLVKVLEEDYAAEMPQDGQRDLNLVETGIRQMDQLIQSLLQLSRLSHQALQKQPVKMNALVRQALGALGDQASRPELVFDIHDLPDAQADPVLLKQVWVNLISNAVKFTRRCQNARIEIGADPLSLPLDKGELVGVVYYVRDNGVGFDMARADRLFGVFQRLHGEEEYEGTGVGLALVQRIVRRHGGRVWAEAEEGKGATFYFTLGQ